MSWLHKLNRINPTKSKSNYKLFKSLLAILIILGLIFKVSQNLAQEEVPSEASGPDLTQTERNIQHFIEFEDNHTTALQSLSSESWGNNQIENTLEILASSLVGKYEIEDNGEVSYNNTSLVTSANNMAVNLYINPPASGTQYIAYSINNILGKPAYAQTGIGFQGLQPILPIWKAFRNIIYVLSAVFFIVIGIMIMFRLKINPQTVLTVQNAIPKIITTLLLVTFSYAIAGLLIDIVTLIQNVIIASLFAAFGKGLNQNLFTPKFLIGTPNNFKNLSDASMGDYQRLVTLALPSNTINLIQILIFVFIAGIGGGSGLPIAAVVFLIIKLVIAIIITINILKFLFGLFKAYINIILKIILAPLEIGISAFPGMKIGFGSWLSGLFANLMVFPITLLFLILSNLIISQVSFKFGLWTPNALNLSLGYNNAPSSFAKVITGFVTLPSGGTLPAILGIATLLILAKLPELVPQIIFSLKPSPLQSAIGADLKQVQQLAVGSAASAAGSTLLEPTATRGAVVSNPIPSNIIRTIVTSLGGKTN